MWMRHRELKMCSLSGAQSYSSSSSTMFILILSIALSSRVISGTSAQPGDAPSLHNLRLLSATQQLHHDNPSSPIIPSASILSSTTSSACNGECGKARKVREIPRNMGEDDISPSLPSDFNQRQVLATTKVKGLYPTLSGSGELFRLFRPLALSSDKTIGMSRWYLPGFGYFSRGGRAASSNFIRFGRSGSKFMEDDDGTTSGGDVTMLSRNSAKKKNNFIRLGRENPRQTNFIRLGRSGPPAPSGEYYNAGYITPALSDPFRDDEDDRHEIN